MTPIQALYPTGILHFTDTNTYHFVPFYIALKAGEQYTDEKVTFNSMGHSDPFDTPEEALACISENKHQVYIKKVWKAKTTKGFSKSIRHSPKVF